MPVEKLKRFPEDEPSRTGPEKRYTIHDIRWYFLCGIVAGVAGAGAVISFVVAMVKTLWESH
jgi:hypothetical protein